MARFTGVSHENGECFAELNDPDATRDDVCLDCSWWAEKQRRIENVAVIEVLPPRVEMPTMENVRVFPDSEG